MATSFKKNCLQSDYENCSYSEKHREQYTNTGTPQPKKQMITGAIKAPN